MKTVLNGEKNDNAEIKTWIFSAHNFHDDYFVIRRVVGTAQQVANHLLAAAREDKQRYESTYNEYCIFCPDDEYDICMYGSSSNFMQTSLVMSESCMCYVAKVDDVLIDLTKGE